MAKYTLVETTEWIARNLRGAAGVSNVELLSDQVLRVGRSSYAPFIAGIVSVQCVEAADIRALVESRFGVDIIVNIPKESYWTGEALVLAHGNRIATGSYGDLFRAIQVQDVRDLRPKETEFLERGLRQHQRISGFHQIHDRVYRISREGLPDITVAMLNEYELTADHLRTARDRYGRFAMAVITNPYGKATGSAEQVAHTMGVEILNWGPFLGQMNGK
jgi:hypothetical protein